MYKSTGSSGVFWSVLLTIFVILKLTGVVDWSWFWVLSPLWIPLALVFFIMLIAAIATR